MKFQFTKLNKQWIAHSKLISQPDGKCFWSMVHKLAQQQFHFFFIQQVPFKCKSKKFACRKGVCYMKEIHWSWRPHIFLRSQSGVGDERGWDFIAGVSTAKSSLTSFSNDVTRIYRTNYPISPPWFFLLHILVLVVCLASKFGCS